MTAPLDQDDRETAELLKQLRVAPTAAARERAFAALQQEFTEHHAPVPVTAPPRRQTARWALAAGVVIALTAGVLWRGMQPAPMVARVESLDGGVATRGTEWLAGDTRLAANGTISVGSTLRVGADGGVLLRLSPDLTLRLAANTNARFNAADELELTSGQVFVDATPGARAPLRIVTPFGEVTHLGTQYQVRADAHAIEVAVREGRAQIRSGTVTSIAEAGHWVVQGDTAAVPVAGDIESTDARFDWIGKLPTEFKLEGSTLAGFLAWFQRETGLIPIYSDAVDAGQSAQVQLKGSIDELEPMEALSYVLATADLAWHREGAKVVIEKRLAGAG
jgi:ferric-dicitrate binding protein FerR (iron transport regulator)